MKLILLFVLFFVLAFQCEARFVTAQVSSNTQSNQVTVTAREVASIHTFFAFGVEARIRIVREGKTIYAAPAVPFGNGFSSGTFGTAPFIFTGPAVIIIETDSTPGPNDSAVLTVEVTRNKP